MSRSRSGIRTLIVFGTSAFAGKIRNINGPEIVRQMFDCTNMESPEATGFTGLVFREKEPGTLAEVTDISVDILFDPDLTPPINAAPENIQIQFRPTAAQATGAIIQFEGFMTQMSAAVPYDDQMTGSYTLVVNGEPTWTPGSP